MVLVTQCRPFTPIWVVFYPGDLDRMRRRPAQINADDAHIGLKDMRCIMLNFNEKRQRHYPHEINFILYYSRWIMKFINNDNY
jgi:hypothetical protein